jgi:catechol 2,3-dioxygenase-like lactoylglutathione lyase family enzyme
VVCAKSEEPDMPKALYLNHVTLIVDNLEKAAAFYEHELGLEPLPAYKFDYPAAFFKINDTQQLHVTEWKDTPSFRGHACLRVDDFAAAFCRFKQLGIIDTAPWGKVRKLPDGTFQMFIRDPAGNLVELSAPPGSCADESFLADTDLCQQSAGAYVSGRADARGLQSDTASLYHTDKARE